MKKNTLKKRIFSLLLTSAVVAGSASTTVLAAEANAPPDKPEDGHTKELDLKQSNADEAAKIGLEEFEDGNPDAETSGQDAPDTESTKETISNETDKTTENEIVDETTNLQKDEDKKEDFNLEENQEESLQKGDASVTGDSPGDWSFRSASGNPSEKESNKTKPDNLMYEDSYGSILCNNGETLDWKLEKDGTLTISGEGNWTADKGKSIGVYRVPEWWEYADKITNVNMGAELQVESMQGWFDCCENLTSVDGIYIPDTVKDLTYTFEACYGLTSLEGLEIPNGVETMRSTFKYCTGLTTIPADLLPASVTTVTNMQATFKHCTSLTSLPDGFTLEHATESVEATFAECNKLQSLPLSFQLPSAGKVQQVFQCEGKPSEEIWDHGIPTGNWTGNTMIRSPIILDADSDRSLWNYGNWNKRPNKEIPVAQDYDDARVLYQDIDYDLNGGDSFQNIPASRTSEQENKQQNSGWGLKWNKAQLDWTIKKVDAPVGEQAEAVREGYSFKGWFTKPGDGGKEFTAESQVPQAPLHLYAHWEKKEVPVTNYTVTFDTQGGNMPTGVDAKITVREGENVGTLPVPTREKATFLGWFTEPENGEKREDHFTPTGNITLYAHWEEDSNTPGIPDTEKYELRFDLNYTGALTIPVETYESGAAVTKFPENPQRQYHEFLGWSLKEDGKTGLIDQGNFTMPGENTTLFAQWKQKKATLIFDTQGGGNIASWTCNLGANLSENEQDASVLPVPQRDGYVFKGWFYDANNGNTDRPATIHDVADKETVTIYAHWEPANDAVTSYTVTFDPRGGNMPQGVDTKLSVNQGDGVGTLPVPTKDNAIFLGWFTEPENGEKREDDFIPTGNITLYAHWDKIESNPSVDDNPPGKPNTHLPEKPTPPDNNNTTPEPPTNPPVEIQDPEVPLAPNPNIPDSSTNEMIPPGPSTTIEDEEVPLANLPVTTIDEEEVPRSNVPIVTIEDDVVPLAALPTTPKTGDESNLAAYAGLLALSAVGLSGTIFFAVRKKKKG